MDLLVATSREEDALRQELRRLLVATGHSKAEHMLSRRRLDMRALETYDDEKAFALFQRFARNGTWQCPTIVNMQVTTYSELAQLTSDARLKYVPS